MEYKVINYNKNIIHNVKNLLINIKNYYVSKFKLFYIKSK